MTLVVYSNNTLYADRCFLLGEDINTARIIDEDKLHIDGSGRVAIAILGPTFHANDLGLILETVATLVVQLEASGKNDLTPEVHKTLTQDGETTYVALTRKGIYELGKNPSVRKRHSDYETSQGCGAVCFQLARLAGKTVEQAYPLVAAIDRAVSAKFDKVKNTQLKPIKMVKKAQVKPT